MRWRKLRLGGVVRLAGGGARESTNERCGVRGGSCEKASKGAREYECLCIRLKGLGRRTGWVAGIILVCRGVQASVRCVVVGTPSKLVWNDLF